MKFGLVPIHEAEGKILAHNIVRPDGGRLISKGKPLKAGDLAALHAIGRISVYVAEPEPGDVGEDDAARRIARAMGGNHLNVSRPAAGRVNLQADTLGVLRVNATHLDRLNEIPGLAIATRPANSVIRPRQTAVTVKIIPFALPEESVRLVERLGAENMPMLELHPLPIRRVALIFTGSSWNHQGVSEAFEAPLRTRIENLGSCVSAVEFISIEEDDLGEATLLQTLDQLVHAGSGLIVVAGEMGIMDLRDAVPKAIERLGGEVTSFGAPVDPGNLLLVAYLGSVPVLGAPGCARSLKPNVIDWILPRLLVGDRLTRLDITRLGHGGLLTGLRNENVEGFSPVDPS
jgi:molybdenum cofactor cytidylyltransferase